MAAKPPVPPKRYFSHHHTPPPEDGSGDHITFVASPVVAQPVVGDIKKFDIQGLKLPALAVVQVKVRQLTVSRNIAGDFGFSIRRVQYPTGVRGELRTVVFVEPTNITGGLPRPDDIKNKLLPGDELLEINGKAVGQMSRDELHDAVRSAGASVDLLVKTAPELAEFCDRQSSGVRDRGDTILLSNVNTSVVEDIPEDSRYWLIHKGGYALVRLEGFEPDGRVRVSVAGQRMVVDSTDVDRSNPGRFDRAADLAALPFLNETSTIHLLRQRLGSNLLYTNAGGESVVCLLNVNDGPTVGDDGLVSIFKGSRRGHMPAHIYGTAQQLYRQIQMTGQDQAIVLTGSAGSGKSVQLRSLVRYLSQVAGWTRHLTYDRLALLFGVLEAFGNSATPLNHSSTRFAGLFSLGFDKAASLRAIRVQTGLLEADRVMRRDHGEHLFHVFYYLFEGAEPALRERLQLHSLPETTIAGFKKGGERENAALAWTQLLSALTQLGFSSDQLSGICSLLGALLHLHAAGATPGSAQKSHFLRAANAQVAANLLGIPVDALANAIFRAKLPNATGGNAFANTANRLSFTSRGPDGPEALISFGAALYNELFTEIVERMNKVFASNSAFSWLSILDIPGSTFHADWTEKRVSLGLSDLIYNYVNERVAELFYDCSFTEPQEVYSRENVDVNVQQPVHKPHDVTRLMDQKQQLLTSTDIDERAEERRGLFAILEEEALFPGASDESLVQRIFVHLGDDTRLLNHGDTATSMVVSHGMGVYQAKYNVDGWVKQAQPCEGANLVRPLLSATNCNLVNAVFPTTALPLETSRLRRATQVAQMELMSKRTSSGLFGNMQGQLEHLIKSVKRAARVHFVHCVLPTVTMRTTEIVDVPFVRCQLRTVQLIEAVRANNRGYPERLSFRDFRRRFSCLAGKSAESLDALDDRAAAENILVNCDIHQHRYRLGISQLLLATDLLVELEDKRQLSLGGLIEELQRACRRHLANKWLQKRRMQDAAIRCIQRNGVAYTKTREWPWWKLYTRVAPLVQANRSDTDVSSWRRRVEELMQQVTDLRSAKATAERKVDELEQTLSEHANTANVLTNALDREAENRVHLERRIQVLAEQGSGSVSRVSSTANIAGIEDKEKLELKNQVAQLRSAEEEAKVKAQRAVAQLQDVEEQQTTLRARNDVLEKKQNRFDADMQVLQEQVKEERSKRERLESERNDLKATVTRKAADLQAAKSESTEMRAVVSRLRRENEEREAQAGNEQLVQLQKIRRELEQKVHAQETELNELADQNHVMQQTVTRLEMSNERMKTDLTRETASRENELDEMRNQYQRRIRGMEEQLSDANEKYQNVLAENRVIVARARQRDVPTPTEYASGHQYKRELRKALALLADTQAVLAHEREAAPSQAILRQLRSQLEDAEAAKTSVMKGKHNLESEMNELRALLEATLTAKTQLEERCLNLLRDKNAGCALIEEKDEQLQAVLRKYKVALQQNHIDHIAIADYIEQIADLENAKRKLEIQANELETELEWTRQHTVEKHKLLLCEQKLKDKENMLELETAHKLRLESIVVKLTDEVEALTDQSGEAFSAREKEQENSKKTRKDLVHLQETIEEMKKKEIDFSSKTKSARCETEQLEEQLKSSQAELKLALRRIEALQAALSEGLDAVDEQSDEEDLGTGMSML